MILTATTFSSTQREKQAPLLPTQSRLVYACKISQHGEEEEAGAGTGCAADFMLVQPMSEMIQTHLLFFIYNQSSILFAFNFFFSYLTSLEFSYSMFII